MITEWQIGFLPDNILYFIIRTIEVYCPLILTVQVHFSLASIIVEPGNPSDPGSFKN